MPTFAPNYVLVCLEHPGRQNPERLLVQDSDLTVELKWSGPVRGWFGTSVKLFAKMFATTETLTTLFPPEPEIVVTTIADVPASPNYVMETVQIGPIGANGLPTVEFVGGGSVTHVIPGTTIPSEVILQNGVASAKIEEYEDVFEKTYFATGEWKFVIMTEENAKVLCPGIHVRGSFYSAE